MRSTNTAMPSPFDAALEDIDPQIVKQAEHDADTRVALIAALREERIERGSSPRAAIPRRVSSDITAIITLPNTATV